LTHRSFKTSRLLRGWGWRGAVRGLFHAHIGWVFSDMEVADERRYAKNLLADPMARFVDRTFLPTTLGATSGERLRSCLHESSGLDLAQDDSDRRRLTQAR
jgi:hypothetical protein